MKLIIEDDEGRKTVVPMVREEITIGRQDGNTIRLTERNVSRKHARLFKENGNLVIEDLGSYNGVRVNGEKVSSPTAIKEGDLVEIGDYDLGVQGKLEAATPSARPAPPPAVTKPPHTTPIAVKPAAPAPVPQAPPPEVAPAAQQPIITPTAGGATAIIRVSDLMKSAPEQEARDLERSEMPRLVGLAGPFRAKEFYLMRSVVKFGRTDENDIVVDHQSVSRAHAKFQLEDGQWKVYDNKSANGVRVNGDEYAVSNVNPGDTLELGHLKFRFCAPGEKFSPPPEKGAEEKQTGGMKPTTAELIAGAQGRGPTPSFQAPQQKKSSAGLIIGVVAAIAIVAGGAFFLFGKGGKSKSDGSPEGEDAVKAGDVLFKQHHYLEAQKLYDQAGETPAPNKKRVADEARGEETYQSIKSAVDAGDGDKAKALFEKCATESTWWCQKSGSDLADPVKSAYAKKHLAAATAAKTAGKNDVCRNEANQVLAFDSGNAEAQGVVASCAPPAEAAKPPPAPKAVAQAPAPENKESKAAKLAKSSSDKLVAHDFAGAVKDAQAALSLAPADEKTQAVMYRSLGYGYAYLNDTDSAKKYLKLFKPFCGSPTVCEQVDGFLAR
ncbi:MAG TPA: FHA domain-containing protein [Myxococcales bacterium]|nr:FHA domain-containing protein [Myxococcales bacterium]